MPTPSLILVPARFKTGKLYTPVATTSGGTVLGASGDFNVTRATTATRVNANGNIEVVASGIPRLDYYTSGGTAGCPALLVEPSAQNLAWNSQTWATGRNWTSINATTVTGTTGTVDPLGTNTANAISPTAVSGIHILQSNVPTSIAYTSGTIYTKSAFFKQGTGSAGRYVQLTFQDTRFTQNGYANFDLQLGTVAVVSGTSADTNRAASIENYGNGWYRCRFTATCSSGGNGTGVQVVLIDASGLTRVPSFTGVTGDVLYGWGAQVEVGSVATSYIPTTNAAVTRNADVISVSGAVSGCIGQTEGTIYVDMIPPTGGTGVNAFLIGDGTSNNFVLLGRSGATLRGSIRANNSFILNDLTLSLGQTAIKAALAYKSGDYALYANGSIVVSGTTSFTFSSDMIGAGLTSNVDFTAPNITNRYNAYALYTTRLTNQQLASLTT